MSLAALLSLFMALIALALLPSSSVALVVARSAERGVSHGLAAAVGITLADLLLAALTAGLDELPDGQQVMFKLTLPEVDDHYSELVDHAKVLKVVALSGGYSREEANARLSRNRGMVASFSRALVEDLVVDQSADDFDATLDASIAEIYAAGDL